MVGNSTLLKNSCMALKYTLSKRRCCFLATKKGFVAQMHAIGETISLNVSFKIHRYTTPHGRWNWSWFSVSLLVTVMTSKDYDYQGLVGILLIVQLQRGLLVMDWLPVFHPWFPCLIEAIPQKRGVHTFSFPSVWVPCFQSSALHTLVVD